MRNGRRSRLRPSRFDSRYVVLTRLRRALEELIARHVADRDVAVAVDVGSGSAPYRSLLELHVARYRTADLPGQGAELEVGPDGGVALADASADLVLSNQVLEHVDDPDVHLHELARLLAPHGLLLISTHGYWMYHPTPRDYWRWTGPGLRRTLDRHGFDVLETIGVLGRAASGLQLLHDGLAPAVPGPLRPLFAGLAQLAMALVDRLDRSDRTDDACVFVVAAQKRELAEAG